MDKYIKKILSSSTSNEEREMLCQLHFGKSFVESFEEIRYRDFINGINKCKYLPLKASYNYECGRRGRLQIEFTVKYVDDIELISYLYGCNIKMPSNFMRLNIEFFIDDAKKLANLESALSNLERQKYMPFDISGISGFLKSIS